MQVQKWKIGKCMCNCILKKSKNLQTNCFPCLQNHLYWKEQILSVWKVWHIDDSLKACSPLSISSVFGTEKRWVANRSWGVLQGVRNFWWKLEWMKELRRIKSQEPNHKPSLEQSSTGCWAEENSGDRKQVTIASSENSLGKLLPGDRVVISIVLTMKYQNYFVPACM